MKDTITPLWGGKVRAGGMDDARFGQQGGGGDHQRLGEDWLKADGGALDPV